MLTKPHFSADDVLPKTDLLILPYQVVNGETEGKSHSCSLEIRLKGSHEILH